jgi:hypothetical protein
MNKKKINNLCFRLIVVGILLLVYGMLKLPAYAGDDNSENAAEIASSGPYRIINLPIGKTVDGALVWSQNNRRYYDGILYKFTLTKSGKMNFSTYTEFGGINYNILDEDGDEIYNECSGTMYYNDKLGMGRDNFYFHLSKGTYYLEITTRCEYTDDCPELSFKITTKFTDAIANEGEPNDDFRNATLLGVEGKIRGQFSISDVKDVYKIKVNKKQELTLKYTSEEAMPYGIEVFDKSGDSIYRDGYVYQKNVVHKITLSPGTNYIVLESTGYWDHTHEMGNYIITYSTRQALTTKNVTLHSAVVTYTGKVRNSTVIVKDNYGKRLVKGKDYTVYVPSGRRNVGTYTYKIVFKGNYKGTVKKVFKIVPAATRLTKAVDTYSGVKLVWSRSSSASGYLIYRSTDGGSYKRIKGITSWRTGAYIDRSATSSWTTYSYKVYVYKKVNGKTYISPASASKSVYVY